MPFNLGWSEIMMVLFLALVFLGPKKLPELASGLGRMIREFRKATSDIKGEIQLEDNIKKPFQDLRDAVTLPAEELKRRDRWQAEWQQREKEEQERAAQAEAEGEAEREASPDGEAGENVEDAHAGLPTGPSGDASGLNPGASSESDKTIAQDLPGGLKADAAKDASGTRTSGSASTIAAPPPGLPSFPKPPGSAPAGTVGAPQSKSGIAKLGASKMPTHAPGRSPIEKTEMGVGDKKPVAKTTPPPPPPSAAKLPPPKAPGRSVPSPDKKIG